jgi:CubicO group peptidase (beta-lactamase class C family)
MTFSLRKTLTAAPLVLLFLAALPAPRARADAVDTYIAEQMRDQHIPGLSLAIVKDGKIVKEKGYGLANVEWNIEATPRTVYEIGSITKQFTATAVMMLVEEGKVGLDDPIRKYLDGMPDAWKDVTVRRLLTHTSGIKGYTELPGFDKMTVLPTTPAGIVKAVSAEPLLFAPGSDWSYSNTGYVLLGMLVEKVSGQPWADFLRMRIFRPLGMDDTRVNDLTDVIPNRAAGYSLDGDQLRNAQVINMSWPFSAGALVSTVEDMAKWDAALYTEKLVKKATLEQMWTPVKLADGTTHDYGFGWGVDTVRGHKKVSHGGGIPGFVTFESRYPDDKTTVIVLTNTDRCDPGRIAGHIAALYVPGLRAPKPKPAKVSATVLANVIGRYEFANNQMMTLDIDSTGSGLRAVMANGTTGHLLPASDTIFFSDAVEEDIDLTVVRDKAGVVTGLTFRDGERKRPVPRIGPLLHTLTAAATADPDPATTQKALAALNALAAGGDNLTACTTLTDGAKKDFSGAPPSPAVGAITFVTAEDVTGRGIERHGGKVARTIVYRRDTGTPRYVLVHFTPDGLVTDIDFVDD